MDPWEKKSKTLTQALIISGALNVAFISTLIAFSLRGKAAEEAVSHVRERVLVSSEVVAFYLPLSFEELLDRLSAKAPLEDGYLERDMALAILVEFHHFNLDRALSGMVIEKRPAIFTHLDGGEEVHFTLFPGLSDRHFETLKHYAQKEKWPLTTQGLFLELKRGDKDPSLIEAFRLSREVDELCGLFHSDEPVKMALEGDFEALSLPRQDVLEVLERYIRLKSKTAVKLFFDQDLERIMKRLDNPMLLQILSMVGEVTPSVERGLKLIVDSLRPDEVRAQAAKYLSIEVIPPVALRKVKVHTVARGDTLWEISKMYGVPIDQLCEVNHLEKGKLLKIGQEVVIPKK